MEPLLELKDIDKSFPGVKAYQEQHCAFTQGESWLLSGKMVQVNLH